MFVVRHCFLLLFSYENHWLQNKKPTCQFISGGGMGAFEARSKLQKLGLPAPEDTRLQHIQQMQGCAFFWVKINMQIAYRRGADLATVLREQDLCLIACVSKMSRLRFPQLYFLFETYRSHTEWGSTTTLSSSAGATTGWF